MSDTDVSVRFGGDTSDLNAAINQARSNLASFSPGATGQAKSSLDALNATFDRARAASEASSASWRDNIRVAADLVTIFRGATAGAEEFADVMARAAAIDASSWLTIQKQALQADADAFDALRAAVASATATIESAPSAFTAYADAMAHGSGAARSFVTDQTGVTAAIGRSIVAAQTYVNTYRLISAGAEKSAIDAIAAAGGLDAFRDAANKAKTSLVDFSAGFLAQIQQIPDTTDQAAISIEGMLGSIPNYSAEANSQLIALIATISANGDAAVENASKIKAALSDDTAAGGQTAAAMVATMVDNLKAAVEVSDGFGERLGTFKKQLADINQVSAIFSNTLQPAAASAYYSAIINRLQEANAKQKTLTDDAISSLQQQGVLGRAALYLEQSRFDREREANAERQRTIDLLTQQRSLVEGIVAAQSREATFQTTLDKANPLDAQIDDITSKISILQGKLDRSSGKTATLTPEDITNLTRTVIGEGGSQSPQGQLAVAAVALNRLANGNFGDTLTAVVKAGNGSQFNTWLPTDKGGSPKDQANAPTPVDSYVYQRTLHDIVMPLINKQVEDPTNGALNFFNPALTPAKNQFAMDNTKTIDDQVYGTAKRSPAPIEPLDDDEIAKAQQALDTLRAKLKSLEDEKAGGNALDQAGLEIAQQHATGLQDQVSEQQKLVTAAKEEVNAAANLSPKLQDAAALRLANEQATLRQKEADAAVAQSKIDAAGYEKDSFDQVRVLNVALDKKLALYSQNSAAYNGILDEMSANTKRAEDKQTADVAAGVKLQIAARSALNSGDPVTAAKAALDAATTRLGQTGQALDPRGQVTGTQSGNAQQLKAAQDYYTALQAYRNADSAQEKATNALEVAQTIQGSRQQLDAKLAGLSKELEAARGNAIKTAEIQRQITDAKKQFEAEQTADQVSQLTQRFDDAKRTLADEAEIIKEKARTGEITGLAEVEALRANAQQRLAIEQKFALDKAQLDAGNLKKYKADMLEYELAAKQAAENLKKIDAQLSEQIGEYWRGAFEGISSSMSSSIIAVADGSGTMKDLLKNAAESAAGYALQSALKVAADQAAIYARDLSLAGLHEAQKIGLVTGGEAAQTSAVAAGTAARTGLISAGAAEAAAIQTLSAIKSIIASAAEAAAATTAYMASFIGPAAVGVGAGVESVVMALVSAVPSLDIGAWRLPADTVAQVHAGEMIVPAGPAAALRAAFEGGGANNGVSRGTFAPVIQYHSHGTRSRDQIRGEIGIIVDELHRAHRRGAFLKYS